MQILFFFCVYITLFVCQSVCQIPYYFDGTSEVAFGSGDIWNAAYSPDQKYIATVGNIGIHLWDFENKQFVNNAFTDESFSYVKWSPSGDKFAALNDDIAIYNLGEIPHQTIKHPNVFKYEKSYNYISFTNEGDYLTWVNQNHEIVIYDLDSNEITKTISIETEKVLTVGVMNTVNALWAGTENNKFLIIDTQTFEILETREVSGIPIQLSNTDKYVVNFNDEYYWDSKIHFFDLSLNEIFASIWDFSPHFKFDQSDQSVYYFHKRYEFGCGERPYIHNFNFLDNNVESSNSPLFFDIMLNSFGHYNENLLVRPIDCVTYAADFYNPIHSAIYSIEINDFNYFKVHATPFTKGVVKGFMPDLSNVLIFQDPISSNQIHTYFDLNNKEFIDETSLNSKMKKSTETSENKIKFSLNDDYKSGFVMNKQSTKFIHQLNNGNVLTISIVGILEVLDQNDVVLNRFSTVDNPDFSNGNYIQDRFVKLFKDERNIIVGNTIWNIESQKMIETVDESIIQGKLVKVVSIIISPDEKYVLFRYDEGTQKVYSVDKLLNQETAVEEFQIHEASMN